jgi:hypothetical protein
MIEVENNLASEGKVGQCVACRNTNWGTPWKFMGQFVNIILCNFCQIGRKLKAN